MHANDPKIMRTDRPPSRTPEINWRWKFEVAVATLRESEHRFPFGTVLPALLGFMGYRSREALQILRTVLGNDVFMVQTLRRGLHLLCTVWRALKNDYARAVQRNFIVLTAVPLRRKQSKEA